MGAAKDKETAPVALVSTTLNRNFHLLVFEGPKLPQQYILQKLDGDHRVCKKDDCWAHAAVLYYYSTVLIIVVL